MDRRKRITRWDTRDKRGPRMHDENARRRRSFTSRGQAPLFREVFTRNLTTRSKSYLCPEGGVVLGPSLELVGEAPKEAISVPLHELDPASDLPNLPGHHHPTGRLVPSAATRGRKTCLGSEGSSIVTHQS